MGQARDGNKRVMITLPVSLVERLESDTERRGLGLTKSARIQLALENELANRDAAGSVEQSSSCENNNEETEDNTEIGKDK